MHGQYEWQHGAKQKQYDTKISRIDFPEGATFTSYTCGGGGYGNPYDRKPEHVLEDFKDGLISRQFALNIYGVVINEDRQLNLKATEKRRQSTTLFEEVCVVKIIDTYEIGPDRTILISPNLAKRLEAGDGELVEVNNDIVPLRGWLHTVSGLADDEISLPILFAEVLRVQTG